MASASFMMLGMVTCFQFLFIISLLLAMWHDQSRNKFSPNNSTFCERCSDYTQSSPVKQQQSQQETPHSRERGKFVESFSSSVYCTGKEKKERECRFMNLCYNTSSEEYLFVYGEGSRMFGLPDDHLSVPLLDISSVDDHSAKYFNFKYVKNSDIAKVEDVQRISGPSILFHRFNPNNIMHVLHDDLIPLYHTQRKYFPQFTSHHNNNNYNNVNYVMMDGRNDDEYHHLYELFSSNVFLRENFTKQFVCFDDVVVGLTKITTWYQFGFKIPQGPINQEGFPVSELEYFREEFKARLLESETKTKKLVGDTGGKTDSMQIRQKKKSIIVFSRSQTRKILNMGPLIFKLTTHFKLPVQKLDLEVDSIADIVAALGNAAIVIGVHGAHLVTSLFMPRGSILIEIFPYAVPSENYTPYKTLAKLLDLHYIPWENHNEEDTVTHEEWPSFLGGISGLPDNQQDEIRGHTSVPLHLCCKDPVWLFRIYQDTIVNVKEIIGLIEEELGRLT